MCPRVCGHNEVLRRLHAAEVRLTFADSAHYPFVSLDDVRHSSMTISERLEQLLNPRPPPTNRELFSYYLTSPIFTTTNFNDENRDFETPEYTPHVVEVCAALGKIQETTKQYCWHKDCVAVA